jgi:hypothetical protein
MGDMRSSITPLRAASVLWSMRCGDVYASPNGKSDPDDARGEGVET